MTDDSAVFQLPPVMKMEDCERLHDFVKTHDANGMTIDASIVERLSGLAAQTLVIAQHSAEKHGTCLRFTAPSAGFDQSVSHLGLTDILRREQVPA